MRAMSEPWVRQENWSEELQFNRTMGQSYMMHGGGGAGGGEHGNSFGMEQYRFSPGSSGANGRMFSAATYESLTGGGGVGGGGGHTGGGVGGEGMTSFGEFRRTGGGVGGLGGVGGDGGRMEHRLGYSSLDASLPHLLDQYSSIYNKNGRIGIYTREVSTGSVRDCLVVACVYSAIVALLVSVVFGVVFPPFYTCSTVLLTLKIFLSVCACCLGLFCYR
jgi:hypothetical protein